MHINSEPCTPDTPSATASPSSSEEPTPLTAPPSPSPTYDCEPPTFSPPLSTCALALNTEMTSQTSTSAAPNPSSVPISTLQPVLLSTLPPATAAPGNIYSPAGAAISPSHAPHLVDWLPYLASVMTTTMRGKEEVQLPSGTSLAESMKRCGSTLLPVLSEGGSVQAGFIKQQPPESVASPPPFSDIPPHSGQAPATLRDILAELQTMNGHLAIIARALSHLASSLAPQQDSANTPGL
uniref:Uncharacterized protein n=1 Tax=Sphaerodactylus townsendi TaxID=933632 RepID=A0ACB8GER1_9SAUR